MNFGCKYGDIWDGAAELNFVLDMTDRLVVDMTNTADDNTTDAVDDGGELHEIGTEIISRVK